MGSDAVAHMAALSHALATAMGTHEIVEVTTAAHERVSGRVTRREIDQSLPISADPRSSQLVYTVADRRLPMTVILAVEVVDGR